MQDIYSGSVIFTLGRLFLQNYRVKGIAAKNKTKKKHKTPSVLILKMHPKIEAGALENLCEFNLRRGRSSVPIAGEMTDSLDRCLFCFRMLFVVYFSPPFLSFHFSHSHLTLHPSFSPLLCLPLHPHPSQTDRRWLSPSVKAMPLPS